MHWNCSALGVLRRESLLRVETIGKMVLKKGALELGLKKGGNEICRQLEAGHDQQEVRNIWTQIDMCRKICRIEK